jgi:23S rRNA (uracil1939-C5)-methyltransferase
MRLAIEKLVYGGSGLARTEQGVVFVPRTAPGDVVEAEVVQKKKDYSVARLMRILEASPDRQEPTCVAGCCQWQHIRYDRQIEYKEAILRESLQRIAHTPWDHPIQRIIGPDRNYRLRATFHVAGGRLGFLQERSNIVLPVSACASLVPELNEFIKTVDADGAREVHAVSTPEIAASFVFPDGTVKRTGNATIHVNELQYRFTADTFFQANRFLLAPFMDEVVRQIGESPAHVLELHSGVGFFSMPLGGVAQEVIAVEADHAAIRQARENAKLNARWNITFAEGQVGATLAASALKPDVVVLDPPRAGCGAREVEMIAALGAERIVYVSCNPSTFAREASVLGAKGYELRALTLVDQFPNTYHIETVASFEVK